VEGLADACRAFALPVVSGNVSFYNETPETAVYPTPVLGVVGVLADVRKHCTIGFKRSGDVILLLGETREDLGGTEYLKRWHKQVTGRPPALDLELEQKVQATCLEAVREGLAASAHDCSDGGLAVALAECCVWGNLGAAVKLTDEESAVRLDACLFGESASRIVISATRKNAERIMEIASRHGAPVQELGRVKGDQLVISAARKTGQRPARVIALPVSEMANTWRTTIRSLVEQ
jgi:phosphoribosylformylglycinamidine synthase